MSIYLLTYLFSFILTFIYMIFMIKYLTSAEVCDKQLSQGNVTFRKVALVLSWISAFIYGFGIIATLILLLAGKDVNYSR